ncbi:MAG TPA: LUD domain-containing protein [Flavisolibacter sp.]|jgi:L-lactate dehydrogenase complex protein LldG|nr:LUD domain-containing protein [Flavisolibacter sp.]
MSSRDKIVAEIRKNAPETAPLPEIISTCRYADPVEQFITVLQSIGGTIHRVEREEEARLFLADQAFADRIVVNNVPALGDVTINAYVDANPAAIERVHTVILRGRVGVAENAAVWVPESAMANRLLPFLCQHLVLVLSEKEMVDTLHEAYAAIGAGEEGYGVFIAGPSKTADIEQSLVLGAHGPLSLQVLLVKEGLL